ncbi:serine/threonine-protein phosphatase 2A activator-like [Clavelina lepadiformis]|uniref:serine/threonine-protein phosphatase 2A activator-like n=1 Tax=Clavelina lepadiformis TaxID=159417 RepID=UPI00404135C4
MMSNETNNDDRAEAEFVAPDDQFANHEFVIPEVKVKLVADMQKWIKSQAYHDYVGFLTCLSTAVKGKPLSVDCLVSKPVEKLLEMLGRLSTLVDETPPVEQPQRFGNKGYRTWLNHVKDEAVDLTKTILPVNLHRAAEEVSDYLVQGFGNETRIDYGTGHEASFASFLCCLYRLRVLTPHDQVAIVTKVFNSYLDLARKLQRTYRMEPAGSQGVWGLDDFQFIPFILGSSQLIMHQSIRPKDFAKEDVVREYHSEYMFLECIKHINEVKSGPFAEHSSLLYSIGSVPHWGKVNSGLFKMYKAEVLQKFPVIQHFKFGSILSIEPNS